MRPDSRPVNSPRDWNSKRDFGWRRGRSRRGFQTREQGRSRAQKFSQGFGPQRFRAGQMHRLRVLVHAVHQIFVMQVRAGGESGHAHITDHFALPDVRADTHAAREARHVAVERGDAVAVGQKDRVAVAAAPSREADPPIAGGVHRSADRRRVIGAHMPANPLQDRMHAARIEHGADPREFDRRTQKRLTHRLAVRGVVAQGAVRRRPVADRAIHLAVIDEFGSQDFAVAQILAVLVDLFVNRREMVAGADIEHEIDVPGKNIGEFERHRLGDRGALGSLKQRGIDDRGRGPDPRFDGHIDHLGRETLVLAHDTCSVWVSLTLRVNSLISPAACVT